MPERDPKSWHFLGSQDGVSWDILDARTNESFRIRMALNAYNINNATAYRFYRLDITANNGAPGVAVAEFGLWSAAVSETEKAPAPQVMEKELR